LTTSQRGPGRPREFNQHSLIFYVHCKLVEAHLTGRLGRTPTDTDVLKWIIERGGHRQFVAGDREQIKKAQNVKRAPKQITSLRFENGLVVAKKNRNLKTLQNLYSGAKRQAKDDPGFRELAQEMLAQYGVGGPPIKDTTEYASGWRPPSQPITWQLIGKDNLQFVCI
jgi:hypothetical protein